MGKETKEMLKTINAKLELIMTHLKIENAASTNQKKEIKAVDKNPHVKNSPMKNSPVKKAVGQKK